MLHIFSHNENSEGARALAQALGIRRIRHEGSRYVGRPNKTVINWGSSRPLPPNVQGSRILNAPETIRTVTNKRTFFEGINGAFRAPEFTTNREEAINWLNDRNVSVVARAVLNGHSAEGLTIHTSAIDFPTVPLYTKYVKKRDEWRIHIAFGQVIDAQRKALRNDFNEEPNWAIRNLANGFVFVRDREPQEDVVRQAIAALQHFNLDFGAVDVIWNQGQGQAYVLEINTAPGLEGQTIDNYANAFRHLL